MSNGHTQITFSESRAAAALVVVALFSLDVMVMVLGSALISVSDPAHLGKMKVLLAFCTLMLVALVGMQIFYLIKMLFPSSLILTDAGAQNIGLFGRFSLRWQDYKEARIEVKSSPKGGRSYYIHLEPKNGGGSIEIFRDGYTQPGDNVFRCIKEAQSGRLIELGEPSFPYQIAVVWMPIFIGLSALLTWRFEPLLTSALSLLMR